MPNFDIPALWVVEYSHSQHAFNVQELYRAVQDSQSAFFDARPSDFAIIALADSHEQAMMIQKVLDVREDRTAPLDTAMARHLLKNVKRIYNLPVTDDDDE